MDGEVWGKVLCVAMGKSHCVAWVCGCLLVRFFRWDWGGSMRRASFVAKRGVWGTFVVLVWRKIQLHQRNGESTLA